MIKQFYTTQGQAVAVVHCALQDAHSASVPQLGQALCWWRPAAHAGAAHADVHAK